MLFHGTHLLAKEFIGPMGYGRDAAQSYAILTLMIVFAFALISLALDRRALLVAGVLYAAFAIGFLLQSSGVREVARFV